MKKKSEFLSENFQFLVVKFSIYLNRRVSVMSPEMLSFKAIGLQLHVRMLHLITLINKGYSFKRGGL